MGISSLSLKKRTSHEAIDLLTSRAFEREARSYERRARKLVPGPTTPDQKTMRTTLRKSNEASSY